MVAVAFVLAAAVGGLTRWQMTRLNRAGLPLGTGLVNVVAAFAAGLATCLGETAAVVVVTGLLGATSTFSTVTAELVELRSTHGWARSAGYAAVTAVVGVAAAWLGIELVS